MQCLLTSTTESAFPGGLQAQTKHPARNHEYKQRPVDTLLQLGFVQHPMLIDATDDTVLPHTLDSHTTNQAAYTATTSK